MVVLMPTANLNSPRAVYLSKEQYGAPNGYYHTATHCLYTQFALTERFDFGVDFIGLDSDQPSQTIGNARFVLLPESKRLPGVAVGVMNLTAGSSPVYYAVGTRTVSFGAVHLGAFRQGNGISWGAGVQTTLPIGLDVALEYFHAPDGSAYTSVGAGWQVSDALSISTYYSRHSRSRDGDVFGVSLSFAPLRLF